MLCNYQPLFSEYCRFSAVPLRVAVLGGLNVVTAVPLRVAVLGGLNVVTAVLRVAVLGGLNVVTAVPWSCPGSTHQCIKIKLNDNSINPG